MSAGIELGEEELDLVAGGKGSKGEAKLEYFSINFTELLVNSVPLSRDVARLNAGHPKLAGQRLGLSLGQSFA
jgi:hypothetical protein